MLYLCVSCDFRPQLWLKIFYCCVQRAEGRSEERVIKWPEGLFQITWPPGFLTWSLRIMAVGRTWSVAMPSGMLGAEIWECLPLATSFRTFLKDSPDVFAGADISPPWSLPSHPFVPILPCLELSSSPEFVFVPGHPEMRRRGPGGLAVSEVLGNLRCCVNTMCKVLFSLLHSTERCDTLTV